MTERFEKKIWLSSPLMHGPELEYIKAAYESNWMSTIGENIDEIERQISGMTGRGYAVALSSGTAALHMAARLAGAKFYGTPKAGAGALAGRKVFCSDMTFAATLNPVTYEGGVPVFIDTEYDTWNMDPEALERAFDIYPDVKLVVLAHLYGSPAKTDEIASICSEHGALLIEDAAESLGAAYKGRQTGSFGFCSAVSFNGNKIITGSSGGMFLTDDKEDAERVRKWSTQSRDAAPWYQHTETGYNYRMSNVIAGVVRGQIPYIKEHLEKKKTIYERYKEGFADLPVSMNPFDGENSVPNYWLSCMLIDREVMCIQERNDHEAGFVKEPGKTCPSEILEKLAAHNAEGRPIWKPMHMQPLYSDNAFVKRDASGVKAGSHDQDKKAYGDDAGADIFARGLCLPSDINMTDEEQDRVIGIVRSCFGN